MIVISLGGSLIVPGKVDTSFLKSFRDLVMQSDERFVIICGGGKTAREYIESAKQMNVGNSDALDWVGIGATRLNAELVRSLFSSDVCEETIISDPTVDITFGKKIIVGCGWKPGRSTDYEAVRFAKKFGCERIINMSNIDYAYDKDPKEFSDAKKCEALSWAELRALVGDTWTPGKNTPFDPIAAKEADGLEVVIVGSDLENVKACIANKSFRGTVIR